MDTFRSGSGDAQRKKVLALRATAILCASISLLALVAHIFGWLPMPYFLTVFGLPGVLLLLALAALAKRIRAAMFLNALWVGLWAGLAATAVYDGVRHLVERGHLFGYNGFVPILMFGSWITGKPVTSTAAAAAGWSYHYWNGASFGIIYTLGFGKRHWLYGVGYGIVMECCMLGLFPMFLRVTSKLDFVAVSMIGHLFYDAALGLLAQRFIRA